MGLDNVLQGEQPYSASQCCLPPPPLSRLSVPHAREDFRPLVHCGLVQVELDADHQDASLLRAGLGMAGVQGRYNPMEGGRHSGLDAGGARSGTAHAGMTGVGMVQAATAGVGMACSGTARAGTARAGTVRAGTARTGTAGAGTVRTRTAGAGTARTRTAGAGTACTGMARTGMGGAGVVRVGTVHAGTFGSRVASGMYHGPACEVVRFFPDQQSDSDHLKHQMEQDCVP